MNNSLTIDVEGCPHCGQDHDNMEAKPFTNPINDIDGTRWTHWFLCPITGEPVLAIQHYSLVELSNDQN